jgi:hypothetical protein
MPETVGREQEVGDHPDVGDGGVVEDLTEGPATPPSHIAPKEIRAITPAVIAEIRVLRANVKVSRISPSTNKDASAATGWGGQKPVVQRTRPNSREVDRKV